ncbi:Calpain-type cysteine protease DEK1 [Capsicum chinense]|nr:Calpain-type cysteine protease DEK1 [Capsicum chinense]
MQERTDELYFGHCISYAVVASVLLGAAVSRHLSVTDPLAARRDALQSTVIRLRESFYRKDQNSSASSSEGCGSSVKCSSSADAGHLGNATVPSTGDGSTWNNIEGINSDKSIDSGRPSLALRSSSCRSVVQEPEILDLNLALAFQEKLSDPRITSMLKRKGRHTDCELANLLQDKGLDLNFAVMLKENGFDPMILALLQSSLDADREHRSSSPPVTDSNDVEDVLPNHISFSEELRLQGLGKWLQRCRVMLHHVAGTPERAWLLFSLIFILETVVVAIF